MHNIFLDFERSNEYLILQRCVLFYIMCLFHNIVILLLLVITYLQTYTFYTPI